MINIFNNNSIQVGQLKSFGNIGIFPEVFYSYFFDGAGEVVSENAYLAGEILVEEKEILFVPSFSVSFLLKVKLYNSHVVECSYKIDYSRCVTPIYESGITKITYI